MRNLAASGELVTISAADPLNLVGFIVPGERVAAISGKYVSFRDGVAVEGEERVDRHAQGRWPVNDDELIEGIDYYMENGFMVFTAIYLRSAASAASPDAGIVLTAS